MDIALQFSEDFPDPLIAGRCFPLRVAKGVYTLGRSSSAQQYDIDVQLTCLSRSQATLTFSWNAYTKQWTVLDAGLNDKGQLVSYRNGCQVNGVFINKGGVPDAHPIDPELHKRILLGGGPHHKILVLPECEATISDDPFNDEMWGASAWLKVEHAHAISQAEMEADGPTASLNLEYIQDDRVRSFVAISKATSRGLLNKETRVETLLTVAISVSLLVATLFTFWALTQMNLNPFMKPHQPEGFTPSTESANSSSLRPS